MIGIQVHIHPTDGTFFIKRTRNGGIPPSLRKFRYFKREELKLQEVGNNFIHFLIDFANEEEVEFWEKYYHDLFISWGFTFIHKNFIQNRSSLLKQYFFRLLDVSPHLTQPIVFTNPISLDNLYSKLNLDMESLIMNYNQRLFLNQFRLMYALCFFNLLKFNAAKHIKWKDILHSDHITINLVKVPVLRRTKIALSNLYSIESSPDVEQKIFKPSFTEKFSLLFNGLMFFYGYPLRIDSSSKTIGRLASIYLIQKKGFSVDLHSFLSKVLGYELIDEIDNLFIDHLCYGYENQNLIASEDSVFEECITELYSPK
ncbi:hypothetical protein [Ekhidna sp.]